MADEVNPPVSADATNTAEETTRSMDAVAEPAVAEAKPAEDGVVATLGVAEGKCPLAIIWPLITNAFVNQFPRTTLLRTTPLQRRTSLRTRM
jgi:hypothetical protein